MYFLSTFLTIYFILVSGKSVWCKYSKGVITVSRLWLFTNSLSALSSAVIDANAVGLNLWDRYIFLF